MQEEADREVGPRGAKHRRYEHEVEVVHPDASVHPLGGGERRLCEAPVHVHVALPCLFRDPQPIHEVVEQGPQRVVADTAVEVFDLVLVEKHRVEPLSLQGTPHRARAAGRDRRPRPPDPRSMTLDGAERRHEPTRARLEGGAAALGDQAHGEAVGDDDHISCAPALLVVLHATHPLLSDVCGGL